jgi:Ca2+-binding RTX toxin-like protein
MATVTGTADDETLPGTSNHDVINGAGGDDVLSGAGGDDQLNGGDGDDILSGGRGFDTLYGGAGDDILNGGAGIDTLTTGTGHDVVVFVRGDGQDQVTDFDPVNDRLEIYDYSEAVITQGSGFVRISLSPTDTLLLYGLQVSDLTADNLAFVMATPNPAPPVIATPSVAPVSGMSPTDTVRIAAGQTFYTTENYLYRLGSGQPSIINNGTLVLAREDFAGAPVAAIYGFYPSPSVFWNQAGGVVQVKSAQAFGAVAGVFSDSPSLDVINEGLIEVVVPDAAAYGVYLNGPSTVFSNSGTIRVWSTAGANAVALTFGGDVENSGLIEVFGEEQSIGVNMTWPGAFHNSGTIRATDALIFTDSIAVKIAGSGDAVQDVFNSGTLEGDYAFFSDESFWFGTNFDQHLYNSGALRGNVYLGAGEDWLINTGVIVGDVDLAAGDDLYEGGNASQTGAIYAGEGNDRVTGGLLADQLFGETGDDNLDGGEGDDFIDGGRGADILKGGAGFDTVSYLEYHAAVQVDLAAGLTVTVGGNDQLSGFERVLGSKYGDRLSGDAGADELRGGAGDDVLEGRAGDDRLVGGTGADTLTGGAGADTFLFSKGDGADEITDFDPASDHLEIHGYTGITSTQTVGRDTRLVFENGDSLLLKNVSAGQISGQSITFTLAPDPGPSAPTPPPRFQVTGLEFRYDLVVDAGEVLSFDDLGYPIIAYGRPAVASLTNYGTISATGELGVNGILTEGLEVLINGVRPGFDNRAGATFSVDAGLRAVGVTSGYQEIYDVSNAGEFIIVGGTDAYGVAINDPSHRFYNSGHFSVTARDLATGVYADHGGVFTNDGVMEVHSSSAAAIGFDLGGEYMLFRNTGSLIVDGVGGIAIRTFSNAAGSAISSIAGLSRPKICF